MYQDGEETPIDYSEPMKWYQKVADLGDTNAQERIENLNKN